MKYIFVGEDSLGYIHGKVYDINVITKCNTTLYVVCKGHIDCPYSSIETLNKNWKKYLPEIE